MQAGGHLQFTQLAHGPGIAAGVLIGALGRGVVAVVFVLLAARCAFALDLGECVPAVKQWRALSGAADLSACWIAEQPERLAGEIGLLKSALREREVRLDSTGTPIRLELGAVEVPPIASRYAEEIRAQAYRLLIDSNGVLIRAASPAGVHYGVQTLVQLLDRGLTVPCVDIVDWPDMAFRGVMVDPARSNENADYYHRLIDFCGRYKLNRIHIHLTDDQSLAMHHAGYGPLLDPHAWKAGDLRGLVERARRLHIELIPEIESLGHARVFLRHPEYQAFLHMTEANRPAGSWTGTAEPGFTNVLCPASERAGAYLADMYAASAEVFPNRLLHIGFDEVDMTVCKRCVEAFAGDTLVAWFRRHLERCQALAAGHGRRVGVWGDMLLKEPGILEGLAREKFLIFDWHYNADVSADSVRLFKAQGFEVVGCPALVCAPYMILPSQRNYTNIRRFAEIVREEDAYGMDTTIWIPVRYLSDALWPGIAFAAGQAWSGSRWDDAGFFRGFVRDFFGSGEGDAYAEAFGRIAAVDWDLTQFRLACWYDDASLAAAREAAGTLAAEARRKLGELEAGAAMLGKIRGGVTRNAAAWDAYAQSVEIQAYTIRHLLAAGEIGGDARGEGALLRELDESCVRAMGYIEADWDRNRFADDPGKSDIHGTNQHLLHRFRLMHEYHVRRLAGVEGR